MDALNAELERKRKAVGELLGDKKTVKKVHLEQAEQERLRQLEREEAERKGRTPPSYRSVEEQNALPEAPKYDSGGGTSNEQREVQSDTREEDQGEEDLGELEDMAPEAVTRRLRSFEEPCRFFGEDETARKRRLKRREADVKVADEALESGKGNETLGVMKGIEQRARKAKEKGLSEVSHSKGEESTTSQVFKQAAERLKEKRMEEAEDAEDQVAVFFERLMSEWEGDVESSSEEWKYNTVDGKHMLKTIELSKKHMQPMLSKLRKREMADDMVRGLFYIMRKMQTRNYKDAGDMYIRLSIGNQPWPIGITQVGIHERSARDKLKENRVNTQTSAHVMGDEQTRKYLQCVKRLITFAQSKYPTLPSFGLDWNQDVKQALSQQPQEEEKVKRLTGPDASSDENFKNHDGWRAWDSDTRTMRSLLKDAYDQ